MNIKTTLIALLLVCLAGCQEAIAITKTFCTVEPSVKNIITQVAAKNNFNKTKFLLLLADYESGYKIKTEHLDVNDKYSYGLFQFQRGTFVSLCMNRYGLEDDMFSPYVQTQCVIDIYNNQGYAFISSGGG